MQTLIPLERNKILRRDFFINKQKNVAKYTK